MIDFDFDDPEFERECAEMCAPGTRAFMGALAKNVKRSLVPNEPMDMVEWAFEYLVVPTDVSERNGALQLPPFQASIVRLSQLPSTRQISHQKPTRIGSSFMTMVEILYFACWEGQPCIYYERSDAAAQDFHDKVLYPVLSSSPKLKHLMRPRTKAGIQDAWSDIILTNGAAIQLRSASNNSSFRAIKGSKIFTDEVSSKEWQDRSKNSEGSKLGLARRRSQQYAAPLLHAGSTPTNLGSCIISAEYKRSDRRNYRMPCPRCAERGDYNLIAFEPDVRMAPTRDIRNGEGMRYILGEHGDVTDYCYECGECGGQIEEREKIAMLNHGEWIARNPHGEKGHIGLFNWAAYSTDPQSSWIVICQEHRKAVLDPAEFVTFTNTILCMPYDPSPIADLDPSALEGRCEYWWADGKVGGQQVEVPAWAEMLTCGGDGQEGSVDDLTKKPRMEFSVVATGRNQRRAVIAHIVIDHVPVYDEFTQTWGGIPVEPFSPGMYQPVWDLVSRDWRTEDGRDLKIRRTFIDTSWRAEDAEKFCLHPMSVKLGIIGIKGSSTEWGNTKHDVLPDSIRQKKSKGKSRRYLEIGTRAIKDTLANRLAIPVPGAQSYTFSASLKREYFESLLAEQLVETRPGVKRWKRIKRKNTGEAWDCMIYTYAAERYEIRKSGRGSRLAKLIDTITPEAEAETLVLQAEVAAVKEANAAEKVVTAPDAKKAIAATVVEVIPSPAPAAPKNFEPALNAAVEPVQRPTGMANRYTIAPRPVAKTPVVAEKAEGEMSSSVKRALARAARQGKRW